MKISSFDAQDVNLASVSIGTMTPEELAHELEWFADAVLYQHADLLNGARLYAVMLAAAEMLKGGT